MYGWRDMSPSSGHTPRVFVSHSHRDDAFTTQLVADLRSKGADVWVDLANITSNDFQDGINEGLRGRDWCVVVLTPNAINSRWVKLEVHAAFVLFHQGAMK